MKEIIIYLQNNTNLKDANSVEIKILNNLDFKIQITFLRINKLTQL